MVAAYVKNPKFYNSQLEISVLNSPKDWGQACQLNVHSFGQGLGNSYPQYVNALMMDFCKDAKVGRGVWMGAYLKNKLVGDMGLFDAGKQRGLICSVKTDPNHRKNGVCRTLLYHAANYGFDKLGFKQIVLVADQNSHASAIYRSVGFEKKEMGFSLIKTC